MIKTTQPEILRISGVSGPRDKPIVPFHYRSRRNFEALERPGMDSDRLFHSAESTEFASIASTCVNK
jgi:hypothetical protein